MKLAERFGDNQSKAIRKCAKRLRKRINDERFKVYLNHLCRDNRDHLVIQSVRNLYRGLKEEDQL